MQANLKDNAMYVIFNALRIRWDDAEFRYNIDWEFSYDTGL